ncbi:MAG: arginine--tRNA ligase [Bacteroidetes Order II. Incertae sedis bacterium]|nr:arginine--tRNA ligase [Bacteroidetes Order II. bacterium]
MKAYLANQIQAVLATIEGVPSYFEVQFQIPARADQGDLASNFAMQLAKKVGSNPRTFAERVLSAIEFDPDRIAAVEVAGPGFINFRFSKRYLWKGVVEILMQGAAYGRSTQGAGKKAMVEYVSANPTGPLTVGHGRNAVLGDTMANVLDWVGYDVTREYYFNDAGRQMRVLAQSVRARYLELIWPDCPMKKIGEGEAAIWVPEVFPEGGYQGAYITDIASALLTEKGDLLIENRDWHAEEVAEAELAPFKEKAVALIFKDIDQTMRRMGVKMDTFFNEHTLYTDGKVEATLAALRETGLVFDADGAVWFKTSTFGKDKETVLVKSSGEPTYRLPDIAYHVEKLNRGYDVCIDLFGADHIDTYPDVLNALRVLGYDAQKIQVVIYQFVTLMQGGEAVKMSTRKANFVTLDDLMDEVGEDVTRYFFLAVSPNTHINFDLDLAKAEAEKNPAFYLQYAHARIHQIVTKAAEVGLSLKVEGDLSALTHDREVTLIKVLLQFPDEIIGAAKSLQPQRLINYLREVAEAFHAFYHDCRIIGEAENVAQARYNLACAAQYVVRNGLGILGLSTPEKM